MAYRAPAPTYEPNPLLDWLYRRFFERIRVDDAWVESVREAASRGSVVYVLRNLSFLDFLALDHLTRRYELPRIRFANDLGLWALEPMGRGWLQALRGPSRAGGAAELERVLEERGSAALFLKRPTPIWTRFGSRQRGRGAVAEGDDLVRALFSVQRRRQEPILLVPQVFVWTRRPDSRRPGWLDAVLGTREWPGKTRTVLEFLRNYGHVALRAGDPINLAEFLDAPRGRGEREDDAALTRRLTYAVLRRLERERRAIVGPAKKPEDRARAEVIKSPRLQAIVRDLAGEGRHAQAVLTARAHSLLKEMQAEPDPSIVQLLEPVFDYVINSIYDGVDVDRAGLDRVRKAAGRGTLVLLPSHKSHIDYIILHYVFHKNDLQLPLVAAGDNLSFFPLGPLFRRAGAFFIRRSFAGDRLYAAVVDAYIRRLIREGYSIEFYLEGGRSRTGKLLQPKLGLLNMVAEAAIAVPNREVFFVPISVGYDIVVEGDAYVQELMGGEKTKEDARGLLRTARVLRGRYGRLTVQFGEVLSFREFLADAAKGSPPPAEPEGDSPAGSARVRDEATRLTPARRRGMVTRIAHRVMSEIDRVTCVTPGALVATALLAAPKDGLSHDDLVEESGRLVSVLKQLGAPLSASLLTVDGRLRLGAIAEAARLFVDAGFVVTHGRTDGKGAPAGRDKVRPGPGAVYRVLEDKRLALDMSKNIIVHFFVPRAFISSALLAPKAADTAGERAAENSGTEGASSPLDTAMLEERARDLSHLFKFEFIFRSDTKFEHTFAETLEAMISAGELSRLEDGAIAFGPGHDGVDGRRWVTFYASTLRPFLEGYRIAARTLSALGKGPVAQKDLVRRGLAVGQRMLSEGELEQREAIGRLLLENAFASFLDHGYLHSQQGKLALAESFATPAAAAAIEDRLVTYLGPRRAG